MEVGVQTFWSGFDVLIQKYVLWNWSLCECEGDGESGGNSIRIRSLMVELKITLKRSSLQLPETESSTTVLAA